MKAKKDSKNYNHNQKIEASFKFIKQFDVFLQNRGHTDFTRKNYLSSATHFYSWLKATPWAGDKINRESVRQFLEKHLPFCSCPSPVYKDVKSVRAALNQLLSMEGFDRI